MALGTYTHCGWHEPVVPGGTEISGARGRGVVDGRSWAVVLGVFGLGFF